MDELPPFHRLRLSFQGLPRVKNPQNLERWPWPAALRFLMLAFENMIYEHFKCKVTKEKQQLERRAYGDRNSVAATTAANPLMPIYFDRNPRTKS
jgi:hypothetical protein